MDTPVQGNPAVAPLRHCPIAILLQPKCLVMDGTIGDAVGLAVTEADHVKVWQTVGR